MVGNGPGAALKLSANRMDAWTNDDLLLAPQARARLEADHPGSLDVFDWPELRAAFELIDRGAGISRKRGQRNGVIAASTAAVGAALLALLPLAELLGVVVGRWIFALAAGLSLLGLLGTLWVALLDKHGVEWLYNRLRTERYRQLYFQFMGHDPALAASALSKNPDALRQWRAKRDEAFKIVSPELEGPVRAPMTSLIADINQRSVWLLPRAKPPEPPKREQRLDEYFDIMHRQRIGIQQFYVREKLSPGLDSPESWHVFIQRTSYVMALMALSLSIAAAVLLFNGEALDAVSIRVLTSLTALAGVVAIYLKVLGDGLQVKADLARYLWYREALADLDARFTDPDPASRMQILREMEQASYRELREFLQTHSEAKFSFG